ncbi:metallophosphoesterase family protein [Providencia huashanensis]|uniref:metallophosphoesterase family protein n=1 Tax=Providencia huashanensis TaxID=3037798 RepID=UPI002AFFC339|nr:metallophosphoesterase [Providencia sp. 23021821]
MTKTTILHLSDLHRDSGSRIKTQPLLSSLYRDRKRYIENEGIPKPDIAVISGDIVYGVRGDDPDGDRNLELQYEEAYETLAGLAERFFDGDREKIIVAPGNHDISMPHVLRAMKRLDTPPDDDKRRMLIQKVWEDDSRYRLNIPEMSVYEITNPTVYHQRLEPYAKFYDRFYEGKRKFSLNPKEQYSIHEYPELDICVVAFSSCLENDLYNRTGAISAEAINHAMDEIAPKVESGALAISVWHHSIQGGPKENDYIDSDFLRLLMDSDCSIGMHGHQHRSGLLENRFSPDVQRHISVISAGTLCGGPRSLPPGRMRGYNVVVLDREAGHGTVHVRAMTNNDFSAPIWERGYVSEFSGSSIQFALAKKRVQSISPFELAGKADELLRSGQAMEAYELLRDHTQNQWVRTIAVKALISLEEWVKIIDLLTPPASDTDFLILSEAYENLLDWSSLRTLINSVHSGVFSDSAAVRMRIQQCQILLRGK